MAFNGVLLRSSRPFSRQVRGFFHGRSAGGPMSFDQYVSPLGSSAGQMQELPLVISGATPNQSLDEGTEALLKSFEVPGSTEIANRLFQSVEVRLEASRNKSAAKVTAQWNPNRPIPSLTDKMIVRFGTGENISALVCRFGRIAYDIANSDDRLEKEDIVMAAVEEILGSRRLAGCEVDAIVDAVSAGQHQKTPQDVTYAATHLVRYLSFANVWQNLGAEQRGLITGGQCGYGSGEMTTDGLIEGLKAFEMAWQGLSATDQCLAKANLSRMAQRKLSNSRVE